VDGVLVQPGDAEIPTEVEETPSIDKVIAFWENATGLIGGTTVSVQLTNGKTIKSTVKDVIIKDMVIVGVILDGGSKANERTYVPWHAVSFVRVH
jgi:hypothetical protein